MSDAHNFDDFYIDLPIKGKDKEWKNYRVDGVVTYSVGNDSFDYDYGSISSTWKLPDYVEDLDTEGLTVYDLSDPNIDEIELDKCPSDLEEYIKDNLFDMMERWMGAF